MDYEEGLKLGLSKFEIEDLINMDNDMIASIIARNPSCVDFIKNVLGQNGKTLDIEGIVKCLVDEIDYAYFDPEYGYKQAEDAKRALKELGYDYDEIKSAEIEEDSEIDEFGESIQPSRDTDDIPKQSEEIDEKLEQWLNAGKSKTPLQEREEELAKQEAEAKTIAEAEALIDKQAEQGEEK